MTRSPDSSLSCWNERQSAGRAGPPIPRHCAPESSPIRDPLCPATIRRAHTRQQRRHTAVAMSSRGRLMFRRACCTHAMDATMYCLNERLNDVEWRSINAFVYQSFLFLPLHIQIQIAFLFLSFTFDRFTNKLLDIDHVQIGSVSEI